MPSHRTYQFSPFSMSLPPEEGIVIPPVSLDGRWGPHQASFMHTDFEEDVFACREQGIDTLNLWRRKLEDYGVEKGRELLNETGVAAGSLSWAGGFTGTLGWTYDEALQDALQALRDLRVLGGTTLTVVTGGRGSLIDNHLRRIVKDALRRLGDQAGEWGVEIVVQPMHPRFCRTWSMFSHLQECADLIDRIQHPAVGLAIDLFSAADDPQLSDALPGVLPLTRLIQLSDSLANPQSEYERQPLGRGVLPIREFIAIVELSGYRGRYEVQLLSEDHWRQPVERSLMQMRRFIVGLKKPRYQPLQSS